MYISQDILFMCMLLFGVLCGALSYYLSQYVKYKKQADIFSAYLTGEDKEEE